jgi:hypothetical protein
MTIFGSGFSALQGADIGTDTDTDIFTEIFWHGSGMKIAGGYQKYGGNFFGILYKLIIGPTHTCTYTHTYSCVITVQEREGYG